MEIRNTRVYGRSNNNRSWLLSYIVSSFVIGFVNPFFMGLIFGLYEIYRLLWNFGYVSV